MSKATPYIATESFSCTNCGKTIEVGDKFFTERGIRGRHHSRKCLIEMFHKRNIHNALR